MQQNIAESVLSQAHSYDALGSLVVVLLVLSSRSVRDLGRVTPPG